MPRIPLLGNSTAYRAELPYRMGYFASEVPYKIQTGRTTVSYSSLIRCSVFAAMVADALLLIAELLELLPAFDDLPFSEW